MIRSMTGYGRAQELIDGMNITVEIKSVNHRYFEFSARTPRAYGFIDEKIKSYVQSRVTRGKIEVYVSIENFEDGNCVVEINRSLAGGYYRALRELAKEYELRDDISVSLLSRYTDIFSVHKSEEDENEVWSRVEKVLSCAVDRFVTMREEEGQKLREDILSRCVTVLDNVGFIEERSPETVKEYNDRLLERIKEVLSDKQVDEQRIITEAAIYADKVAVAEETVRLRSHVSQLRAFMDSGDAVGKKTDFLVQEMNREANTIGSKAQDIAITKRVIDIKAEIEKIREQVQNIE